MVKESDLYLVIFIPIVFLLFFAVAICIAIASKKDASCENNQICTQQQQFIFVQQQSRQQPPVYSLAVDMPNYSLIRVSQTEKQPEMDLPPSYESVVAFQQHSATKFMPVSTLPI